MPIPNFTSSARPSSYDLIDAAFNRAVAAQQPQPRGSADLFDRGQQGPAFQAPDAALRPNQGQAGQGQPPAGASIANAGGGLPGGNFAQLLSLMNMLQQPGGFLPSLFQGQKPYYQKPRMLEGQLGQAQQQFPGLADPSLLALFSPQSYTGGLQAAHSGGPQLQQDARQQALDYIMGQLPRMLSGGA